MDEHKRALHALNRLTFGPKPGDIDRVAAMGVISGSNSNCIRKKLMTRRSKRGWLRSAR